MPKHPKITRELVETIIRLIRENRYETVSAQDVINVAWGRVKRVSKKRKTATLEAWQQLHDILGSDDYWREQDIWRLRDEPG